jgi:hypothetical protein
MTSSFDFQDHNDHQAGQTIPVHCTPSHDMANFKMLSNQLFPIRNLIKSRPAVKYCSWENPTLLLYEVGSLQICALSAVWTNQKKTVMHVIGATVIDDLREAILNNNTSSMVHINDSFLIFFYPFLVQMYVICVRGPARNDRKANFTSNSAVGIYLIRVSDIWFSHPELGDKSFWRMRKRKRWYKPS